MLKIEGQVDRRLELTDSDLGQLPEEFQVADVTQLGARRPGRGVKLTAVLRMAGPQPSVTHLGLHGTRDDFHASIPIKPVQDRAVIIYQTPQGDPLPADAGGPFRFWIPDHAACHTDEIDECANVKFLDRIELTAGKGYDNRPMDDDEHARLHDQST